MIPSKKNILVIEDHDSLRLLLGNFLSKTYSVTTKKDGLEGMSWIGKGNIPDLILLDLGLPQLNGLDFLRNIRTSGFFSKIPVVVVSGNREEDDINQCLALGAKGYVTKPFNPLKLNETVSSAIA